jgi:hypothetical protein
MAAFETIGLANDSIHKFLEAVIAWEVIDSQKNTADDVPDSFKEMFEGLAVIGKELLTDFVNQCLARADEVSALNTLWENS